jgi:predicted acyl esterase
MSAGRIVKALIVAVIGVFVGMGMVGTANAAKPKAPKTTAAATFQARGSIGEVYVVNAEPGDRLMLVSPKNRILRTGRADTFGSELFYYVKPGPGYSVRLKKDGEVYGTKRFNVRRPDANPPQSYYDNIELKEGLNYVKMRDGIELAMTVRLPFGKTSLSQGPFPTYIEYSGYQVAAPKSLIASVIGGGPSDPLAPATSTAVGSVIGPLLDFAVVSVQMRGSGCSGGAFDLFGLPTTYDGYDAIETVAAQDWVKGDKVGMGGISFSGITQLFTAGTQPPHLAAISPLSVTDDMYTATGYPGGIFNKGFAFSWISQRADDAQPGPEGGQPWSRILSDPSSPDYDPKCAANQRLRLQTMNYNQLIEDNEFRTPSLFRDRSPGEWVSRIKVPTFLVGAFQDEQTGGHFVDSIKKFPKSNRDVWINLTNGVHADSLGPSTITRWTEFMKLFVAKEIPEVPSVILSLSSDLYEFLADAPALPVQQSQFKDYTSVTQAKADFRERYKRVHLMMDNGAAIDGSPGAIGAAWSLDFNRWPVPSAKPTTWWLGDEGKLTTRKPGTLAVDSYTGDPSARPPQTLNGANESDSWVAQPDYNWAPIAPGKGLGWITPALSKDTVLAGSSSLDVWVKSSARDTDLQVTLTEVRPDGKETLVQNGWLRASHRKLDRKQSTVLNPVPTHLKRDAQAMRKGKFELVRVPLFAVAHAFREGSRIRINLQAPGGDRQIWDFGTLENGTIRNTIGLGGKFPSRIVLPVLETATAKGTPLPVPTALRGQPSRTYVAAPNGG